MKLISNFRHYIGEIIKLDRKRNVKKNLHPNFSISVFAIQNYLIPNEGIIS